MARGEMADFLGAALRGEVPDYQVAAWLMAVCCRGMTDSETADLTDVMAESGQRLDLSRFGRFAVDKHSTGGVGDKITLVAAPLAAACGLIVGKMSGRGLGHTGGTVDKLESIRGFSTSLDPDDFQRQLDRIGIAIVGQGSTLAPLDGLLYALRDATATVPSQPLIASSIMSKKIAGGASAICLDVKVGRGALMQSLDDARQLARTMVDIGARLGRYVVALLTDMDAPLGHAIGNALEVGEAVDTLAGRGPEDVRDLSVRIVAELLVLTGAEPDLDRGTTRASEALRAGRGLEKLREMVEAQGGDPRQIDDPRELPRAPLAAELPAQHAGYLRSIDTARLGSLAMELGGGRREKGDAIDHRVGLVVLPRVGDLVRAGEPLAIVHCRDRSQLEGLDRDLLAAFAWSELPPPRTPLVREVVTAG